MLPQYPRRVRVHSRRTPISIMKNGLTRLLLAVAVTLAVFSFASLAQAQQADEDPAPATPPQHQPKTTSPSSGAQQASTSPDQEPSEQKRQSTKSPDQTEDSLAFTGRIAEENGALVLRDAITKVTYRLDDPKKAKSYEGREVKIVGKLDMKSNTIHIDTIDVVH